MNEKRKPFMPDDGENGAIAVLDEFGITHDRGLIKLPVGIDDAELLDAIDYLCDEWDYSIAGVFL